MDSRMEKYQEADSNLSRVSRNQELYQKINNSELDNFTVKSNATVLGNQEQEIDIEKIKKILDTKYNETPKRKSIRIETDEESSTGIIPDSTTKEYDLNQFLAKARDDKEETYEEARAKKLRNTQFDILSNLDLPKEKGKETEEETDPELMELINTITINEVSKDEDFEEKDINPLEIFEDLKGNENTEVFEGIKEEIEKIENTSKVLKKSDNKKLDESFYTTSNLFKKKDFEEDDKFFDDDKMSLGVKILIVLLVICFLAGLYLFLKSYIGF